MKLLLRGHDDRYAVEQLQLALFPEAVSYTHLTLPTKLPV